MIRSSFAAKPSVLFKYTKSDWNGSIFVFALFKRQQKRVRQNI